MAPEALHFERILDDDLAGFLAVKLAEAREVKEGLEKTKAQLEKDLAMADKYVSDCEKRLSVLGLSPIHKKVTEHNKVPHTNSSLFAFNSPDESTLNNVYNSSWGHLDKIRYVLRNPSKYGLTLFKGASSIVKAILIEEPTFKPDEKTALIQIAPQVSRVVKTRDAVKLQPPNNKVDFYFISSEWFEDDGNIKPQHKAALEEVNLPLIRP